MRPFTAAGPAARAAPAALAALAAIWAAAACGPPSTDAGESDAESGPLYVCGNGLTEGDEECDDGNDQSGDGCSVACFDEGPPVECGNGWVELGETCDDGTRTAGDGCDASCQVEPFACAMVGSIACAEVLAGDSAGGTNAREDHCSLAEGDFTGPELVYEFVAAVTEEVVFELRPAPSGPPGSAGAALGLAVVPDACEGLLCAAWDLRPKPLAPGAPPVTAVLAAEAGTSYFVYVDGHAGAAAPFELRVGCAADAVCGDGLRQGGEACDDGNALDGDGCAADCRAEASPAACAPAAATTSPRVDVGPDWLRLSVDTALETDDAAASCAVGLPGCGGGPDAVIEIHLAPGLGALEVSFEMPAGSDHFLAVSATDPACIELACEDPYPLTSGTRLFAGLADPAGALPTTVYLLFDACAAATASEVALGLRGL